MDAENVAVQGVNAVDSCKNTDDVVPVEPLTGSGEAVSEADEKSKNGEFSSKYNKSIPSYSLCWYVATVTVGKEDKVEKLMNNLKEPIEVWMPGIKKMDKDNLNAIRAYKFDIHSFVFFRFRPFAPKEELPKQYSGDFQCDKYTNSETVRKEIFNNILSISSVQGILKIPGENTYAPIPAYQINRFRKMLKDGGQFVELVDGMISKGKKVVFTGKYQGLEGVVDSISDNEQYVYILIDYLGCAKIKVERGMVELAKDIKDERNKNEGKKIAINRTITDKDWLALHPYDDMMPVDKQYVAFANSILSYLGNGTFDIPFDKRKPLALTLACYVEDKRSRLRLFSSFVAALRQKKERIHPIEKVLKPLSKEQLDASMADYSPTKINAIDLCYILFLYHDFGKLKTEEKLALGTRLCSVLHNLGSDKLQRNNIYADECRNLLLEGWYGFKKFLHWIVNGRHYLWQEKEEVSVATILGTDFTLSNGINPLYFTLTYARKSKVGSDIVSNIVKLKILPSVRYDVLDDDVGDEVNKSIKKDRKKKRFQLKRTGKSHTSKKYDVSYDEISKRNYIVGETYKFRLASYGKDWYLLTPPIIPMHKVLEYRDITTENLALMTDDEFINGNHALIDTINEHKDAIVTNKWLSEEAIEEYTVAFRKAEAAKGKESFPQRRKEVEKIIVNWNQGDLNPNRTDVSDDEFYKITDALYLNMQHTDYLTDAEWYEKYKDLTADKQSEVVEQRKAASDYVDFPNPYRKEMEAAWQLPDGYDEEEVEEALSPLAAYLPKAMSLYEKGETKNALGVCFDLFDMIIVMMSRELKFFFDDEGGTTYAWALGEVALYPICKIYNDKSTSLVVNTEIKNRIEAYGKTYEFPKELCINRAYKPKEVFNTFGTFERELEFYDFFGLNPYNIHKLEEAEELSAEEYYAWSQKILKEVFSISDYDKLSMVELAAMADILMYQRFSMEEEDSKRCGQCLDKIQDQLLSRIAKSTDLSEQSMIFATLCKRSWIDKYELTDDIVVTKERFNSEVQNTENVDYHILHIALQLSINNFCENTLRSWANTQNADGSWTDVSADEAYGRIRVIGDTANSIEGIDKDRITFLAYNYYSPTPCTTVKELHAKFMAYETKYRRYDEQSPAFIHRQAIAILQQESLSLADCLLLYDILL